MSLMDTRKQDIEHHLNKYPDKRSAVMPILYIAQEEYGYLTPEAITEVADLVGTDVTHVKGIIGFYAMYYDKPKGKNLIYICTDLPCALKGAEKFSEHVCEHLGVAPGGTTEDGLFTVEHMMCLGACHRAPVMQVDFHFHENMTAEKVEKLLSDIRSGHEATKPYTED